MVLADRLDAIDYYNRDATAFAARYASVTFESVHPLLLRHLPPGGRALDIGAGAGRDARALAARGFAVTAVEPSDGLRRIGEATGEDVHWLDDRLPGLSRLADDGAYDLILCSAVLMLIAPANLGTSFARIGRLLAPDGRLALNVRSPTPAEPAGLFHDHSDVALLAAAETAGLTCIDKAVAGDALGRDAYRWRSFIFRRRC